MMLLWWSMKVVGGGDYPSSPKDQAESLLSVLAVLLPLESGVYTDVIVLSHVALSFQIPFVPSFFAWLGSPSSPREERRGTGIA